MDDISHKKSNLKQLVIDSFGGAPSVNFFSKKVQEGLWIAEEHFIEKYFAAPKYTRPGTISQPVTLLDLGCGAGRTTIPFCEKGFSVTGVDIVPEMITAAKKLAAERELPIDYRVADAENLPIEDNTFDYAFFSNQGWSQIPGKEHRLTTLKEVRRVLKPKGIFIFTAHPRTFWYEFPFWLEQWVSVRLAKPLGFSVDEEAYGDRFFTKEPSDSRRTYATKQYIHFTTKEEVQTEIEKAGLILLEASNEYQISEKDIRRHPPVFYVTQK